MSHWFLRLAWLVCDFGAEVVARELDTARRLRALHCLTGSHALLRSTARSSDPDRGRVEVLVIFVSGSESESGSDADPRSRVESPLVIHAVRAEQQLEQQTDNTITHIPCIRN